MILKSVLVAGLLVSMNACSHQKIPVSTIYSSNLCAVSESRIKTIKSQQELKDIMTGKPKKFLQKPIVVPQVNFKKQSLILIALGQKPTLGYSIELTADQASLENSKLIIPVSIRKPDKGQFQAQVISSPCKIFSFPRLQYSEIVIDSSTGKQ